MNRLRVLVVDDSPFCRVVLREILEAEGDIEVVGELADGAGAREAVDAYQPDLVTMDVQMPGVGGLQAIEQIMASSPRPILVVTNQAVGRQELVFEAIQRGALDLYPKPRGGEADETAGLRALVRRLAKVRVVRHLSRPRTAPPPAARPPRDAPAGGRPVRIVGVAASAGGPFAIAEVLGSLPRRFPAAIAVVQHLPQGFVGSFVSFLQHRCELRVEVVEERVPAAPGCVYLAADDRHLVASSDGSLTVSDRKPVEGYRPSATYLFQTLGSVYGAAAVGVVLTGIGNDGAAGLASMRERGALTFAQDEASCVVYGMPKAAVLAGGAAHVLPLSKIAGALVKAAATPGRPAGGTRGGEA